MTERMENRVRPSSILEYSPISSASCLLEACEEYTMLLPLELRKRHLGRFDELITQGETLYQQVRTIPGGYHESFIPTRYDLYGGHGSQHKLPDRYELASQPFMAWRTSCASLLDQILPTNSVHRRGVVCFQNIQICPEHFDWGISILKALKVDYENGFLGDLVAQIETEFAADYMGQAERLLPEGQLGRFDHVPAAMLAGAVLEKTLRDLCKRHDPSIPTVKDNGEYKGMNSMIDDLKRAGVYNELKAKQLRSWADIRNSAAHGQFDRFRRTDVEQMLKGIKEFLGEVATWSQ
jgi:hypothetical protein